MHRTTGRGGHRTSGWQCWRQLRQRSGQDDQWSIQSRGHPPSRPMAQFRGCRICNTRMDGQVQQPPPHRTHRKRLARKSRSKLPRSSGYRTYGRVSNFNQPPANPVRFTVKKSLDLRSECAHRIATAPALVRVVQHPLPLKQLRGRYWPKLDRQLIRSCKYCLTCRLRRN